MEKLKLTVATNRHPVDELAEIRDKMRALKGREATIREQIIAGEVGVSGDEFEAVVSKIKSERVDTAALKREFGLKFLRPFLSTTETTFVRTREKR